MSCLKIENLQAGYGDKLILDNINLSIEQGEMIALLGPSGCGKTTLLNALSGFVPVTKGTITVTNRDITHLAPEKRNITMVFQSYALWPHMTVAQNIAYGLKVQKQSRANIDARVKELLTSIKLEGLENERVTALSGGQRQRVALARALAIRPDVLVLDEPLSNLDAKVRLKVRHEIKALQKQFGFTSLIVTHDQEEALVMADRIAILNHGKIEQFGTPEDIYNHPSTPFVADFMGADNAIEISSSVDKAASTNILFSLNLDSRSDHDSRFQQASQVYFRSEAVRLSLTTEFIASDLLAADPFSVSPLIDKSSIKDGLLMRGRVEQCAFLGNSYRICVRCGDYSIQANHHLSLNEGTDVSLQVPLNALHVFSHSEHQPPVFSKSN